MLKGTLSQTTRVSIYNGGTHLPSHTTGQVTRTKRKALRDN